MNGLTSEDWHRVKHVFDRLVSLPAAARVGEISAELLPAALQELVSRMLEASDADAGYLDTPAGHWLESESPIATGGLQPGQHIGNYRILGVLGSGGTGEVYLVERADGLFEQRAALKRLRIEAAREWERFHAERQILARLDHPAIARLLDAGLDGEGRPYTVVEYVQGRGFLEHCAPLPLAERLRLFLQVCDAVAYAHTQLVIHRDIKPGNLMASAAGQVKLLDFGVAKLLDPASLRTGSQTLPAPFTPDYAAPEQIDGGPVSTATDVYALGVVLFELLTGRRPWSVREMPLALAVERMLHQQAPLASAAMSGATPVTPRQVAGDLDAIIAKALRKEPQHRYATVAELAQDLRRHLRGEPLAARAGARVYIASRFLRRHRRGIALTAFALMAALGAIGGYQAHRQRQAELRLELAQRELRRGNAFNDFLSLVFRSGGPSAADPRQILRAAAGRALQQYEGRPDALADVVLPLCDLFIAVDDTEAAGPVLEQYLQRYAASADPADVAQVENRLATVALRRGDVARAAELLGKAQAFWGGDSQRYREDLLSSRINQAGLERAQGDVEGAVRTLRQALAQRLAEPGGAATSLALYQNLASMLIGANHLQEAARVFEQGWAQFQAQGQTRTPEALSFLTVWAVFAVNQGHLAEAERRYRECVELREQLYGESTQLASALAGEGRALALLGKAEEALPLLRRARDMAARTAGPKSLIVIFSQLFEADAELQRGNLPASEMALGRARDTVQGQDERERQPSARLDEVEGRLRMAQQRYDEAARLLDGAEAAFRKGGEPALAFLAQALVSRGELALVRGDAVAALPPLREASTLRERLAAPGSWLRAEADGFLGEALLASGDPGGGLPLLRAAVDDLQRELGANHPLTVRLRRSLPPARQ